MSLRCIEECLVRAEVHDRVLAPVLALSATGRVSEPQGVSHFVNGRRASVEDADLIHLTNVESDHVCSTPRHPVAQHALSASPVIPELQIRVRLATLDGDAVQGVPFVDPEPVLGLVPRVLFPTYLATLGSGVSQTVRRRETHFQGHHQKRQVGERGLEG